MADGYYMAPALHGRTLIFVSEDDLFVADLPTEPLKASMDRPLIASRLTACSMLNGRRASSPCISPCGKWVAYVCGSDKSGDDVWILPIDGGGGNDSTQDKDRDGGQVQDPRPPPPQPKVPRPVQSL